MRASSKDTMCELGRCSAGSILRRTCVYSYDDAIVWFRVSTSISAGTDIVDGVGNVLGGW